MAFIEFSPNGRWLLAGFLPSSYYIWDVVSGTGRQLRMPVGGESSDILVTVVSAAFDPGSTRLAIVSPTGSVEILDVTDEEERCHVVLGASGDLGGETRGVAFSPNGDWVLTVPNKSVRTHAMRIWDARTGVELLSLEGHAKEVYTACISPCGKYVASASRDCTVRLWRTSDGSCIAVFLDPHIQTSTLVFSPDGKMLVAGADNGSVIIRKMCDVIPIEEL